jgi:hypothetical protein
MGVPCRIQIGVPALDRTLLWHTTNSNSACFLMGVPCRIQIGVPALDRTCTLAHYQL